MASQSSLRASDADREAVAERLRHAAAEGRIEPDELEERLHVALRARTYGDLRRLLRDLPAPRRRADVMPATRIALAVALRVAVVLAVVVVALVAIAVMAAWWTLWALVWLGLWVRARLSARAPAHRRRLA